MKHKKDAIEWGVIGADRDAGDERDRGPLKDKTGLGHGWGRTPRDGRGPKTLKSVWRDWAEAEEFRTKFEVLTAEEVERREVERERASRQVTILLHLPNLLILFLFFRRLRRETSKFQSSTRSRRRF
jgi:chromatin structure-remodeling complex subunit SFH1